MLIKLAYLFAKHLIDVILGSVVKQRFERALLHL